MMISKSAFILVFVALLVLELISSSTGTLHTSGALESSLQDIDCGGKCRVRCSKASRTNMCLRACGTCCERCHCVPPGTYGNYDTCSCYANMKTHEGRRKCP
ncbi:Gibberellin regulated protein [Artemisia annua]|uniref:Gibberellin regulated protein n=1 Tax=Artemisia annua TaxID=35608 RepID=A0A2U1P2B2_ARTAN|nr:Gibberellin regulated protein [Artemisia annua]